jgi:hypothetical protein
VAAMRSPRRTADHCAPIGGWLPRGRDAAMMRAYGIAGHKTRHLGFRRGLWSPWLPSTTCLDSVSSAAHTHAQMERPLGAAAAVLTWVGWLAICPALGFPILGTASMVNRAFFGIIPDAGHEPDFWLGWVILIAALVGAVAVFLILERLRLVRASVRTGVIYGTAMWLLAGLVVMPLLGTTEPSPATAPGQPADVMHATVMMYTLGPLASVAALIAWVLFGAILGATASGQGQRAPESEKAPAS